MKKANRRRRNITQAQTTRRLAKQASEQPVQTAFRHSTSSFATRALAVTFAITTALTGLMGQFRSAHAQTVKPGTQSAQHMTDEQLKAEEARLKDELKKAQERKRLEDSVNRLNQQLENSSGEADKRRQEELEKRRAAREQEIARRQAAREKIQAAREQENEKRAAERARQIAERQKKRTERLAEREQRQTAREQGRPEQELRRHPAQQVQNDYQPPVAHITAARITKTSNDGSYRASLFGHDTNNHAGNPLREGSYLDVKFKEDGHTIVYNLRLLYADGTVYDVAAELRKAGPQYPVDVTRFQATSIKQERSGQHLKATTTNSDSAFGKEAFGVLNDALTKARQDGNSLRPGSRESLLFKFGPIELRH